MAAPTHQLTLVADERRYDLVVPVGTRVTDVLSVLGISSSAAPSSVATASGHVYGPHDRLGDDLPAGSVLTVVRTTTHALHRGVVSIDRSSAAPGSRSPGAAPSPAGGGGGRAVLAEPEGAALVDDSTRRRDDLDPDATVSRVVAARARPRRPDAVAPLAVVPPTSCPRSSSASACCASGGDARPRGTRPGRRHRGGRDRWPAGWPPGCSSRAPSS